MKPTTSPVAYSSTLIPGTPDTWQIAPQPPLAGKLPQFNYGDTMIYTMPDVAPHTKASMKFKKQGPPHDSRLATPFQEFNQQNHESHYKYHMGDILTFDKSDAVSNAARWQFTLRPHKSDGDVLHVAADNDPELQVGSGLGDGDGHK